MSNWGLFGWNTSTDPKESKIVAAVDVGRMFGTKSGGTISASVSGNYGVAASAQSKNADLAAEWLKRMAGVDRIENARAAMTLGSIPPVVTAAWSDPELVKERPILPKLVEQAKYMVHRPSANVVKYNDWSLMVQIEIGKALSGQVSPKQALDTMVNTANQQFPPVGV